MNSNEILARYCVHKADTFRDAGLAFQLRDLAVWLRDGRISVTAGKFIFRAFHDRHPMIYHFNRHR